MGNQCCATNDKNAIDYAHAPKTSYEEANNMDDQFKKKQIHAKVQLEQNENEENEQQVDDKKFKRELKTLRLALEKAETFKQIVENAKNLTFRIYELEQIINYFSKTMITPPHILNVKSDLIGLYGDLQNFRSFHSRFTLDMSYYEHLDTITQLLKFIKSLISSDSKYNDKGVINYQQLVFDLNSNQQFDQLYNNIKPLRNAQNNISGTNFSTLPNYLYCCLKEKKGFSLWEQILPYQFEVSNKEFVQAYTGLKYKGALDTNNLRTGHGQLIDDDYEFQGEFKDDLPHGNGIETRKKVKYEGEFKAGFYHGHGVLNFPNGRSYTGGFQNHQFHGQGTLIGDDGTIYEGQWIKGQLFDGLIKYHDGSYYVGQIKNNFFKEGKGIFYNQDGFLMYQGEFQNYNITGNGSRFYYDGSVYEGDLERDKKQGKGNANYKDESMYQGEWENDFQSLGTYYYNKKNLNNFYTGQWLNGIQSGKGKYVYPSGGVYEGEILNNKRHGNGIYKYSNGNIYDGQWIENNQQGDGKFMFSSESDGSGDIYMGQFDKGKFSGFGHYIYRRSQKQYIGIFFFLYKYIYIQNIQAYGKTISGKVMVNSQMLMGLLLNVEFGNVIKQKVCLKKSKFNSLMVGKNIKFKMLKEFSNKVSKLKQMVKKCLNNKVSDKIFQI
ncbi:MORN repeat protein [Ichthyophthirius multifiliis]|uniref:MORN repeat protein n=1 Tax=Ichthyophthirius multifiliis TaxID=5932 RepID=G0R3R4_ICHMU|nr:MORN repeat protein [Ichthyophthirius multifiliis]EGR27881.1 MORN repeat protein [Ichthyophthirius multifiliis]|eukprot:XP_004027226.1 MORN repeat protein [Ichthyophthirius multifiliis]